MKLTISHVLGFFLFFAVVTKAQNTTNMVELAEDFVAVSPSFRGTANRTLQKKFKTWLVVVYEDFSHRGRSRSFTETGTYGRSELSVFKDGGASTKGTGISSLKVQSGYKATVYCCGVGSNEGWKHKTWYAGFAEVTQVGGTFDDKTAKMVISKL